MLLLARRQQPAAAARSGPAATQQRRLAQPRRCVARGTLKENVAALPPIDDVVCVTLQPGGHTIPNAPGKAASARIYSHLAGAHGGRLTAAAAAEGLALYGEYVAEAREVPGSHPNIDVLLEVLERGGQELSITVERAGS
ncbi:hypothetical protein HT031_005214 [Scenedesmus sp. PABB004]|nr:hypothetical protein HT031_005214 [Scenedesmus sp. PABB004]